ncbi:MAG: SpoVG family protein [Clostridiales bacterium]|jgi:stage V sporulation protein G|nr:SpoVG family protein [Clostridiales bacterium]
MKIKVRIKAIIPDPGSALKAVANVIIDDMFKIHNVRIVRKNGKMFASMPSVLKDGEWLNVCHPVKNSLRDELDASCLEAYNQYLTEKATSGC